MDRETSLAAGLADKADLDLQEETEAEADVAIGLMTACGDIDLASLLNEDSEIFIESRLADCNILILSHSGIGWS